VFAVSSVVMFQPWALDSCKIFQDGWGRVLHGDLALDAVAVANVFTYERYRGGLYTPAEAETQSSTHQLQR
jgi:hypothetical protein